MSQRRMRLLGPALAVAATGVVLVGACVGLARVPNLAEAPRTFLVLYTVAMLAYAAGLLLLRAIERPRGAAAAGTSRSSRPDGDARVSRSLLLAVLGVGVAGRLVLAPAAPTLSTDAYRYVWDARVAAAGISPYRHAPADPALAFLRDEAVFPRLNHPTWRTIYPPAAQVFFRGVHALAPDSVLAMKLALGAAELAALILLAALVRSRARPAWRLAIYAWSPLVLVEVWGSAHLDALVVAAVVAALAAAACQRPALAGAALGLGTLVKLYPAALLPLLLREGGRRAAAAFALGVAAGYAPFLLAGEGPAVLGSLPRYLAEEYFNPGLVRSLVDHPLASLLAVGAWVLWAGTRDRPRGLAARAVPLAGGVVVLGPNVFPWYALWLVALLVLAPAGPWIVFTGTVAFAYAFFFQEPWAVPGWARLVQVAPLALGAAWWVAARRPRAAPAGAPGDLTSR